MIKSCQDSIEGGWCRRCVRMRSNCDLGDSECARHSLMRRVKELELHASNMRGMVTEIAGHIECHYLDDPNANEINKSLAKMEEHYLNMNIREVCT